MREFDNDKHTHTRMHSIQMCVLVCVSVKKIIKKNCWKLSKQATELQKIKLKKKNVLCARLLHADRARKRENNNNRRS